MKPNPIPYLIPLPLCLLLGACSDPADQVQKSAASAPRSVNPAAPATGKPYTIRAESTIGFAASKVTRTHQGGFKNFAGTLNVAGGRIVGNPEIKIALGSLWTDEERLTRHLKSPDFFDVQHYPVSTFTVTQIEPADTQTKITGNLDLHGVSKSISFPANIQVANDVVTVKAGFAINRRDFNINYPGMPNDLIRDNVIINLDLKATPGAPRPEDQLAAR